MTKNRTHWWVLYSSSQSVKSQPIMLSEWNEAIGILLSAAAISLECKRSVGLCTYVAICSLPQRYGELLTRVLQGNYEYRWDQQLRLLHRADAGGLVLLWAVCICQHITPFGRWCVVEWVACRTCVQVCVPLVLACRVFLRCRHASKQRFMKRRTDVSQKLQLLDNKRGTVVHTFSEADQELMLLHAYVEKSARKWRNGEII